VKITLDSKILVRAFDDNGTDAELMRRLRS